VVFQINPVLTEFVIIRVPPADISTLQVLLELIPNVPTVIVEPELNAKLPLLPLPFPVPSVTVAAVAFDTLTVRVAALPTITVSAEDGCPPVPVPPVIVLQFSLVVTVIVAGPTYVTVACVWLLVPFSTGFPFKVATNTPLPAELGEVTVAI
jgi:hypothetical protein